MKHRVRCLIADKMHDSIEPMLNDIGVETTYLPNITRIEIRKTISDYDCLVIRSKTFVDEDLLQNASRLKYICRAGAGIDNLDVEWIKERGITIYNAPEGNRDAVAEHTMGLLLALLNNIIIGHNEVKKRKWDREGNRGVELNNKTVAIIGYGNMGKAVTKRLAAFGCKVLVYDKYIKEFEYGHQHKANMEEVFEQADIVSLHVPLTEETLGWVNENFIKKFHKEIYLINTARGEIVKNEALVNAIKKGTVIGAALDVLEKEEITKLTESEQLSFDYLANSNRVIITPHVAGWSSESYYKINKVIVDKLEEGLNNAKIGLR